MKKEHDGCDGCVYSDKEIDEEPCTHCKSNYCPDLWQSKLDNVNHPAHYCQEGSIECIDEMAEANISKLKARYPEGFDAEHSLHRKEGDI